MQRLLPDVSDDLYAPFWEGTRQRELRVQKCAACGAYLWPPRPLCPRCQGGNLTWVPVSPRGTVYSFSISYRPFHPAFADKVPYGLVLVDLEHNIRMLGNMEGLDELRLRVGLPVEAAFEKVTAGVTLVQWQERRG